MAEQGQQGKPKGKGAVTALIVIFAAIIAFGGAWFMSNRYPDHLPGETTPRMDFDKGCASHQGQVTTDPDWGTVCKVNGVIWDFYGDGKNGWKPQCWYPPYWTEGDKFNEKTWNDSCHSQHPEATIWHYGVPSPK